MNEGHSLDHGHKTDIVSGRPVEEEPGRKGEKQLAKLRERQVKHEALLEDLRSGQGRLAVEKIHEALDSRVAELVQQDPTASALMGVLQSFGVAIVVTRRIRKEVEELQDLINRS